MIIAYPYANRFYQAKRSEKYGDNYLAQNEYTKALQYFQEANSQRSSDSLLGKIKKSNTLKISEENYQLGKDALESKDYEQAIKYFSVVDNSYPQYKSATEYIAEAQEEIKTLETRSQPQVLGDKIEQINHVDAEEITPTETPVIKHFDFIPFPTTIPTAKIERYNFETYSFTDDYKINEAERKAREAESCQRSTEIYSNCMEDFNRSMEHYADCNIRKNEEMEKYSTCIDKYNNDLERFDQCFENASKYTFCPKPENFCYKPLNTSCLKPMNWCTKPYCN
ncbi:hypothetical protein CO051_03405 [Candidatus Roizmanbacteria bacterium CG_4_9_14_0_2_um_filter_39_13]|uniref:Uncharacterized protein n=1 Tax=Candidatus Roizmanbacteria bacterium CG_4_9_14_0_2_um_filter_39_13 TaxID=1974839 RepID=A0A2M8EZA6_9BACT|nr:MAG: hypothetical protein CO051_03405 [Candidatus Roizmanbacteria bacterium CG_4_9_14_0_2_um_filter_39_13]